MRLHDKDGLLANDDKHPTVTREMFHGGSPVLVLNLPDGHSLKMTPAEAKQLAKRLIDFMA